MSDPINKVGEQHTAHDGPAPAAPAANPETLTFAPSLADSAPPPAPGRATSKAPSSIGQYEILGHIAEGGMGIVYKARQVRLNRLVALKMIRHGAYAGAEELTRFQLEAEAVARLQHPHIVQVYEIADAEGRPFIAMEYMGGGTLARKLANKPLVPADAAILVETLARAVHAAHEQQIIHRDLKPANIMLAADGTPKISDFGLAKVLGSDQGQTNTGAVIGTPSYMAPEQAAGAAAGAKDTVGPAADVYALGAILYEALVGRPPFKGATVLETLDQVRTQEPVSPRHLQPAVPVDLDTICLKCLQKDPAQRYVSALALADDLARFQKDEPIVARPIGVLGRLVKWARRRPAAAALVLVSVLACAGLAGGGIWSYVQISEGAKREKNRADDADFQKRVAEEKSDLAGKRLVQYRHAVYNARLSEVGVLAMTQPSVGLDLLEDTDACPFDLREWTWRLLHHQSKRRLFSSHELSIGVPWVMALSADGAKLASCNQQGRFDVWDVRTRTPIADLGQADKSAARLRFSPDGTKLALVNKDGRIHLWDIAAKKRDRVIQREELQLYGMFPRRQPPLAFSPDGKQIALAGVTKSNQHIACIWEVATGTLVTTLEGHSGPINALEFTRDGQALFSGSADKTARYWPLDTKSKPSVLVGHTRAVRDVAVHPNGQHLATASEDGTMRIYLKDTLKLFTVAHPDVSAIQGLHFAPDFITAAAIGLSGQIRVLDPYRDRELFTLAAPNTNASVAFLPGKRLAYLAWDHVEIYDLSPARANSARGPVLAGPFAMSTDGRTVAVALATGEISVREARRLGELRKLPPYAGGVSALAFVPNSPLLVSAPIRPADENGIEVWDATTGTRRFTLPGEAHRLAPAPDGKTLATVDIKGTKVRLWDLALRKERSSFDTGAEGNRTVQLAYAPAGKTLATASMQGRLFLRDAETGRQRHVLEGHASMALALAFSPDGTRLASGSLDESVKIWDVASGKELATLQGHHQSIIDVAWTPDGATVVSVGLDETVRFWDVARARERASLRPKNGAIRQVAIATAPALVRGALAKDALAKDALAKDALAKDALAKGPAAGGDDALILSGPGYLQFWDVPAVPVQRLALKMSVREINEMALARRDQTLAIAGTLSFQRDDQKSVGFLDLWQLDTGQKRARILADFPSLHAVAFSPDEKTLAVGGKSPNLWLVDPSSGAIPAPWPLSLETIRSVAFAPDGKWLAVGGQGTKLYVLDVATREVVAALDVERRVDRLAFTPDGKSLIFLDGSRLLRFWDTAERRERPPLPSEEAAGGKGPRQPLTFDFHLSADGKKIVSVRRKEVAFLDLATFEVERRALKSDEPLQFDSVALAPDSKTFVTGGIQGSLELWQVADGKRLARVPGNNDPITRLQFTPDGKRVIAVPMSGPRVNVLLWSLPQP